MKLNTLGYTITRIRNQLITKRNLESQVKPITNNTLSIYYLKLVNDI